MKAVPGNRMDQPGVSVIACTNRQHFMKNLFANYVRQTHPRKELIVIVNDNTIPLEPYRRLARKLGSVRVYRVPEHRSLGACLNYAFKKTKYGFIAKFDDDDYYAPHYLTDSLLAFRRTGADVLGKRAHYMYLQGSRTLILRFAQDENRPVAKLPGATLVMKRKVLKSVPFPDRSVGEDDLFCLGSRRKGFKVYSSDRYNFLAVRRKNSAGHTWIISDKELLAHHRIIPHAKPYRSFVERKPRDD